MKIVPIVLCVSLLVSSICCGHKSGRLDKQNRSKTIQATHTPDLRNYHETNVVRMEEQNGVYTIPVTINDVSMYFIFDTGASLISISSTEAIFLYKQGKLTRDDILGKTNFIDANGNVSEGTVINLREVKIGNKVLNNIQASVVDNLEAPLLMGQSALQKFGKISIDYQKQEITFQ